MSGAARAATAVASRMVASLINQPLTALLLSCGLVATAWASGVQELEPSNSDTDRVPLYTVVPDYPPVARRDRIEGVVQVCFEISRAGKPRRIGVRKSTHRLFERPSIRAVKASSYVPLPKDAPVPAIKHCRTFRFELEPVVTETANRES